ncbi:hypothetical protein BC828DRAFT_383748 [Blastocladiella britannica]|nr:hypothetical protein BC828DRAFT_383748 [Blastocladiella britannica]
MSVVIAVVVVVVVVVVVGQPPSPPPPGTSRNVAFKPTVLLKDTNGQHRNTAIILPSEEFDTVDPTELKALIWSRYSRHLQCVALATDDGWLLQDPSIELFDESFIISTSSHPYRFDPDSPHPVTEAALQGWRDHGTPFELAILKYGCQVTAKPKLLAVQAMLRAGPSDRAGAPNQITEDEIVERLRAGWGGRLEGQQSFWTMWAARIVQPMTKEQRERLIDLPPPSALDAMYTQCRNSAGDLQVVHLRGNLRLARELLASTTTAVSQILEELEVTTGRARALQARLQAQLETVASFEVELGPVTGELETMLHDMPDTEDVDHQP